jgi:agmatinase
MTGGKKMEISSGSFISFLGGQSSPGKAQVTILGVPFDGTTSFLPGSRFAPTRIREVSYSLETYSPLQDRDLSEINFFDQGDIELPIGNTPVALERIEEAVCSIYDNGSLPLIIGGEHLISLPVIRAARAAFPDLVVVHFDAHTDLRHEYLGEQDSHATVMRRVIEVLGHDRLYQFGMRSGLKEEFVYAREHTHFYPGDFNRQSVINVAEQIKNRPVYISVDIDIIDPAFAPGTGTPEPGGWQPAQLLEALKILSSANIVGSDLVEVCPPVEHGFITSILGAKIIREKILSFYGG